MSPRTSPFSKTHRYLEVLVLLFLVFPLITELLNPLPLGPLVWLRGAAVAVASLALVFRRLRHLSWIFAACVGLSVMVVFPEEVEGSLLCLLAAFLLFDSGWLGRYQTWGVVGLGAAFLSAQAVALALHSESLVSIAVRSAIADGLILVLVRLFRRDLAAPARIEHPLLDLTQFELTARETQILHLIWGGESIKGVAAAVDLSDGRVRNCLSQIYRKLGVPGAKELYSLVHTHRVIIDESRN